MTFEWMNARIVGADSVFAGRVRASDGMIAAVDEDRPSASPGSGAAASRAAGAGAIDCEGDYLLPGLVDLHTDHLERHFTPRPGVDWNGLAAAMAHDAQIACAGITTVFDSLALIGGRKTNKRQKTVDPMIDGITRAQQSGMLRADHRLHLRCEVVEDDIVDRFNRYVDNPLLTFMSLMDHSPGQRQFPTLESYRRAHVELMNFDPDRIEEIIAERIESARTFGPKNREMLAEIGRVRALPIASHDDQTEDHVDEAASLGITVAEFPTTLEAARASRGHGMQIVMGAPNLVRGGSHSGNIAAGTLAKHDLLDILSSDYVPVSMLQATFRLTEAPYDFLLPKAVATVSANPARAGGLDDRGAIAVGLRADVIRVRLAEGLPVVRGVEKKNWKRQSRKLMTCSTLKR